MANIPHQWITNVAASVGTDIYIFGGSGNNFNDANVKYDTLTNTYINKATMPTNDFKNAIGVGTDIFLFGSGSNGTICYKYNTLTDTYTKITNSPYSFSSPTIIAVGTDIYILGGWNTTSRYVYKYDTLKDTYFKLTDIPYDFISGSAAVINNNIYIFGGSSSKNSFAKYNIITDTWTQLTNMPFSTYGNSAVVVRNNIYLLGGSSNYKLNRKCIVGSKTYETDNTVVLLKGYLYNTELFENNFEEGYKPTYGFADVLYYTTQDGLDYTIPTYYGDGTQWINIKNQPST